MIVRNVDQHGTGMHSTAVKNGQCPTHAVLIDDHEIPRLPREFLDQFAVLRSRVGGGHQRHRAAQGLQLPATRSFHRHPIDRPIVVRASEAVGEPGKCDLRAGFCERPQQARGINSIAAVQRKRDLARDPQTFQLR